LPSEAEAPAPGGATPPRVNVIITTYNHARYLRQAIEGALAQQGVSFDITIIDDVSTDGTGAIIAEFVAAHPQRIRMSCPPVNLFSSAELRRVVNRCEAEFIALMDGDDYWTDPAKLRKQVAVLDEDPGLSMCFHDCAVIDSQGRIVSRSFFPHKPPPARIGYRHMARGNYVPGPTPMVRREAIAPLPEWIDPCDWSDWAIYLLAAEYGPLAFIPESMAAYRVHPQGIWSGMSPEDRFDVTRRFIAYFAGHLSAEHARLLDRGIATAWARSAFEALEARDFTSLGKLARALLATARGRRGLVILWFGGVGFLRQWKNRLWAKMRSR
jgi:glycosyltransferase involved in cell wall biosynthesis